MPDEIEQEDPSPEYVKGFNEGYILSFYAPEIGGVFGAYAPETERGKGFRAGKESFAPQPKKEPYPDYLKDASDNAKDMDVKDSPEKRMEEFKDSKNEQGLAHTAFPAWLQDKEQNKEDMDIADELDKGEPEPR